MNAAREACTKCGERHSSAKLKNADILVIRNLLRDGISQAQVARQFGVHHTVIWEIARGRNWKHVKS